MKALFRKNSLNFLTTSYYSITIKQSLNLIQQRDDLTTELVSFEENILSKIRIDQPEIFDEINYEKNQLLEETFNYIVKRYNSSVDKSENIHSVFNKIGSIAKVKGVKFDSVFSEIGKTLNDGYSPITKHIYYASYYVSILINDKEK